MKRLVLFFILFIVVVPLTAQESNYVYINQNNNHTHVIKQSDIDSMYCSKIAWTGEESSIWQSQILFTKDRKYVIPLNDIESVQFGMPYKDPNNIYYSVYPLEKESGWDSLMVASSDMFSLMRTNKDGIVTIAIDTVYANGYSKTVIYNFTEDMMPLSIITDNDACFFVNLKENTADLIFDSNGEINYIQDVPLLQRYNASRRFAGVSKNSYWEKINFAYGMGNMACDASKAISGKSPLPFITSGTTMTLSNNKTITRVVEGGSAEMKFYISMTGSVVGAVIGGPFVAVGGAFLSYLQYFEEKDNQYKDELYRNEVGYSEIETLLPQLDNNTYRLGVKVSNTPDIPTTGKTNTFGLILQKVVDGNSFVNLYNRDTNICFEYDLISDGEFYKNIPDLEPGATYVCRAFILPASEKERMETGKNSIVNSYNSYAYYGDVIEFKVDGPKRNLKYEQVSAENTSEDIIHFKARVEVDIIDFTDDIEKWGILLFKDDIKIDLGSDIEIVYLRSGPATHSIIDNSSYRNVEIEFDARRESLTINNELHKVTTKDHWKIGTYVQYGRGENERQSIYFEPLDLVYNNAPEAVTLEMKTTTRATSAIVECEFKDFCFWKGKCGVEYWTDGGPHIEKYVDANKNGKYSIELTDLSPFTIYEYRAFVNVDDLYYSAKEIESFVTQMCKLQLKNFELLESSYDYNNYHFNNRTYSFRFHCAATWEIETLDNVYDWGYKYIDPYGKSETLSLKEFGRFYKDSRYAYYRNSRESEIWFLPYVKYGNMNSRSKNVAHSPQVDEPDEDVYYGDTIKLYLIYDKQPEPQTKDVVGVGETSAKVNCAYYNVAPWEGICGVEYWSDNNHMQKTINVSEDGEVEIELTNLLPNTTYQYRAFIKACDNYYWAEEIKTFTTKQQEAQTLDVVEVGETFAKVKCAYSESAWRATCGIEYWSGNEAHSRRLFDTEPGVMEIYLTGLKSNTSYQYRAFIIIDNNLNWAEETKTFTTRQASQSQLCPDGNHPHLVDLGLPSGTKWACCNVGASKPEDCGRFYAWGEIVEKDYYSYDNYIFYDDMSSRQNGRMTFTNIGHDIAGTEYDVASVLWGNIWCMPNYEQILELQSNCTSSWVTINGMNGRMFVGSTGNTVFFPASGDHVHERNKDYSYLNRFGVHGFYWSSTKDSNSSDDALSLTLSEFGLSISGNYIYFGFPVRPIQAGIITTEDASCVEMTSATLNGTIENYDEVDEK